ncbi:hypothetical protein SOASR014_32870 [Pectobacterium carotovorum subsp. carotovorum]|nr:hypothetical protein SOASR014_32870 [Pectobacterium carotovorum subsp. carotovorum]GLX45722.1 hypothetical protein Pcaca01_33900 [Pectobacterium carotovorum subsp. carotovorum]
MTTLSTTQLIEAMRTVAVAAETDQGREKLNAIANRMEMLVAANADMDLQLNSIRSALNIPDTQSVQSGVIDAFSRKSSDIEELTEKSNRLRRTAKEHHEENQQLRTELAELRGQKPIGYVAKDAVIRIREERSRFCSLFATASGRSVIPVYPDPVPPAASNQDYMCDSAYIAGLKAGYNLGVDENDTDLNSCIENYRKQMVGTKPPAASQHVPDEPDYWVYDTKFGLDISREKPEHEENVEPYFPVFKMVPVASQPYTVPDEMTYADAVNFIQINGMCNETREGIAMRVHNHCRAAMLQLSGNSPVSSALVAENLALKEIIDRITDLDNEPQYHESGMGCGLEDRNITDRYEAMRHGWDAAMERVYGEVIPCAEELSFPATEQAAREIMAKGVDQAASGFHEKAFVAFEGSNEPGLYIRAQLQLLAQQLRDGDA